jgi:predicted peroxiredoxin
MTHKSKLALLLWSVSPDAPALCAAPFVYASAAAAMDCEVEVHFAADAVRLLAPGVAAHTFPSANAARSVLDHMQDAAALGARFLACSMALHERALALDVLIPECTGAAGATAFVVRTLDPEWATLVF